MHPDQGLSIAKEYVQVSEVFQTGTVVQCWTKIDHHWFLRSKSY